MADPALLYARSLLDILSDIQNGRVSAEEVTRSCLARIASREHEVAAWQYKVCDEDLITQAQAPRKGALCGIPIGVKDLIDTADMPTGYGSSIYEGYQPGWDASCVVSLREEGSILFGKTVSTEFAYFQPGKTRNPHNPERTPGGSSSGSAAAVADGHVYGALGTQTAGSVIRPASFCGTVGYKPTTGLLDLTGVRTLAPSLDHLGVFTRKVADAAYLVSILARRPGLAIDPKEKIPTPRIGFCRTHEWDRADDDTKACLEDAANRLSRAGATVFDINLPDSFSGLAEAQAMLMDYEASFSGTYEVLAHPDLVSPKFAERVQAGRNISPQTYDAIKTQTLDARAQLDDIFGDCDVLLCPSVIGEAPKGLDATGDPLFNRVWTLLGVPCINVPGLSGTNKMPIGIQIVGRMEDDLRTLQAACWVEKQLT